MNITTFIPNPGSSDNPAVSPAKDDKEKIKVLHKAYIDGYPDKSFGGEKSVTREQIAKMSSFDVEGAEIYAETVSNGDPTYAGQVGAEKSGSAASVKTDTATETVNYAKSNTQ